MRATFFDLIALQKQFDAGRACLYNRAPSQAGASVSGGCKKYK
jgi:hypothetical protein